jgi:hypothetical protein
MTLTAKKTTIKGLLNINFRIPQRINVTRLQTDIICRSEVFKNKEIIKVYKEIDPRFLTSI